MIVFMIAWQFVMDEECITCTWIIFLFTLIIKLSSSCKQSHSTCRDSSIIQIPYSDEVITFDCGVIDPKYRLREIFWYGNLFFFLERPLFVNSRLLGIISFEIVTLLFYVTSTINLRYWLKNELFVKRSLYISIENPLHKQSINAYICL